MTRFLAFLIRGQPCKCDFGHMGGSQISFKPKGWWCFKIGLQHLIVGHLFVALDLT